MRDFEKVKEKLSGKKELYSSLGCKEISDYRINMFSKSGINLK